ncbi:MAG TPA: hypothetical protein VFJ58_08295 [Armatimonadota bacterium]|nr:hypothetical protein [Armatimonadota bacterium]
MLKSAGCAIAMVALALAAAQTAQGQQPVSLETRAPGLSGATTWINSQPLSMSKLRGHVVALHFWTFG